MYGSGVLFRITISSWIFASGGVSSKGSQRLSKWHFLEGDALGILTRENIKFARGHVIESGDVDLKILRDDLYRIQRSTVRDEIFADSTNLLAHARANSLVGTWSPR